ncbi:hypothetical protein ACFXO9_37425 [Nocardia tengchongensis]
MIDHVYISVTDIDQALAFYLEALAPAGWRRQPLRVRPQSMEHDALDIR